MILLLSTYINHHFAPPFGESFFIFFPTTEQANQVRIIYMGMIADAVTLSPAKFQFVLLEDHPRT